MNKNLNENFIVKTAKEETKEDKILNLEQLQINIRLKRKIIDSLNEKICELEKTNGKECIDIDFYKKNIETTEKQIIELIDEFRGRAKVRTKQIIYVPMDIDQIFNYLTYIAMFDNIVENTELMRTLINSALFNPCEKQDKKENVNLIKRIIDERIKKGNVI